MRGARRPRAGTVRALLAMLAGCLVLAGCSVYDVPLPGGADTGDDPIRVRVEFRDVLDLVPQSSVKVGDVTVGRVRGIELDGSIAVVTMELPRDIDLPANAHAEIRQTSLLGEKFVSLSAPEQPQGRLVDGAEIGLADTGRNPEVEEVLSALSAVLNGGGVAQLKTIAAELNTAVGGREQDVRSVLDQLHLFMGQLDRNKTAVVQAIESLNTLARRLRDQDRTIELTLDKVPAALASVDRQRADLVRMLRGLNRLSRVGVRVIDASKTATVDTLRDLSPVLFQLARAGDALPRSLQVVLTYPFVDEAVGRDPQVARNLHMGDYTNLSIRVDLLDLLAGGLPGLPNITIGDLLQVCRGTDPNLGKVCDQLAPLAGTLCSLPVLADSVVCRTPGVAGASGAATPNRKKTTRGKPGGGKPGSSDLGAGIGGLLQGALGGGRPSDAPTAPGADASEDGLAGLLHGLGLGRAAPNSAFRAPASQDPYGFGELGLDPALSTLLLRGVLS